MFKFVELISHHLFVSIFIFNLIIIFIIFVNLMIYFIVGL